MKIAEANKVTGRREGVLHCATTASRLPGHNRGLLCPVGQGLPFPLDPGRSLIVLIFKNIYLFFYLTASGLSCSAPAPERAGSAVAVRGLCCPAGCGI